MDDGSTALAGSKLTCLPPTNIQVQFIATASPNSTPWTGFRILVPHSHPGQLDNEDFGFGVTSTSKFQQSCDIESFVGC